MRERVSAFLMASDNYRAARQRKDDSRAEARRNAKAADTARVAAEQALTDLALEPASTLPAIKAKAALAVSLIGGEREAARAILHGQNMQQGERLAVSVTLDVLQLPTGE